MARLSYSARAFADLERLTDFLMESDPAAAGETIDLITEAVTILQRHPLTDTPSKRGCASWSYPGAGRAMSPSTAMSRSTTRC